MYYLLNRSFIYTDLLLKISDALDHDFFKCYSDYRKARKVSKDIWQIVKGFVTIRKKIHDSIIIWFSSCIIIFAAFDKPFKTDGPDGI